MGEKMREENRSLIEKDKFFYAFVCTIVWGIISHGYCYFNITFSHDSLGIYQDADYATSLGRFVQMIYLEKVRGNLFPPFLTGLLSLIFLGCANSIVLHLLELKNKVLVCITCGILTTNVTITLLNATYIHFADIYMLALFFSVIGVYICEQTKLGWFVSAIAICIMLGLYQPFFQVTTILSFLMIIKKILAKTSANEVLMACIKYALAIISGLILYSIVLRIVLSLTNIQLSNDYNGLNSVGQYSSFSSVIELIIKTYTYTISYFLRPRIFRSVFIGKINLLLLLLSLLMIFWIVISKKIYGLNLFILAGLLLSTPFVINIVYFISHGVVHLVMIYSFFYTYVFAILLLDMFLKDINSNRDINDKTENKKMERRGKMAWCFVNGILSVIIFNSIIYANQVYMKKDLEFQTTMITFTRIIDRIEQVKDYKLGETPVAILGSLDDSPLSKNRWIFSETLDLNNGISDTGLWHDFAVTYYSTYQCFFEVILNYPINLMTQEQSKKWEENEIVQDMPVFPETGSCKMIDNVLVVKLSAVASE